MKEDDIDRIMRAAMTEYDETHPEEEESFGRRWARYRQRMYMREYRQGLRRRTWVEENG